ncbi:MAG: hypothetical protein ACREQM_15440 [Candidatus Dormibacteraceae bacterium]
MMERRPWDRLRSALRRDAPAKEPHSLDGLTVEGAREWADRHGLTVEADQADLLGVTGTDDGLGRVEARWALDSAAVAAIEVTVRSPHPSPPPELAAFLLEPLAAALPEPDRSALDTWARGQLAHRGPYNAATTLSAMQLAIAIEDGDGPNRTWTLTARAR